MPIRNKAILLILSTFKLDDIVGVFCYLCVSVSGKTLVDK